MQRKALDLFKNLAVYGLGDTATSIVGFLLLPLYVRYLSPADYGVIALLLTVEVVTKIVFRWGIDSSFMRLYYDCQSQGDRRLLASTLFWFLAIVNGSLLLLALGGSPWLASWIIGDPGYGLPLALVLITTFIGGFYFIPFHLLRIQGKSGQFIGLTVANQIGTLLLRLLLVIALRLGVIGVVLADLIGTIVFATALTRWFATLIRPMFSWPLLRQALRIGLPRLPHGVAHQVVAVSDRYILRLFVTLGEVGLYSVGASFGLALKLFLSAFENAWAPFYFSTMKEPDAQRTFSRLTTYVFAVLVLLACGLAAVSRDLIHLMTGGRFDQAAGVIPWIAAGVVCQGWYLLTSIGLNITKRTEYYPLATGIAAATSIGANLVLVPRFGIMGAACSNALAYGVLAAAAFAFSRRFYRIDYEWRRLALSAAAGVGTVLLAVVVVPSGLPPLLSLFVRGGLVLVAYPLVLFAAGFFREFEIGRLDELAARLRLRRVPGNVEAVELAGEVLNTPAGLEADAPDPDGANPSGSARA